MSRISLYYVYGIQMVWIAYLVCPSTANYQRIRWRGVDGWISGTSNLESQHAPFSADA